MACVLIVDDSTTSRRQLRPALEAVDVEVVESVDGSEAMRMVEERRFDLILTDIHMPKMDGLHFVQRLRKLPGYAAVPVLVLTSDNSSTRIADGKKAGVTAWIVKPPDVPSLVSGIVTILSRQINEPEVPLLESLTP